MVADGELANWLLPALITPPGTSRLNAPVSSRRSRGIRMTLPQHSTESVSIKWQFLNKESNRRNDQSKVPICLELGDVRIV